MDEAVPALAVVQYQDGLLAEEAARVRARRGGVYICCREPPLALAAAVVAVY